MTGNKNVGSSSLGREGRDTTDCLGLANFDRDEDHQREDVLGEQRHGEPDAIEKRVARRAFGNLYAEAPVQSEPGIRQNNAE